MQRRETANHPDGLSDVDRGVGSDARGKPAVDSLKEAEARLRGVDPVARRLAVGLSAIVGDKEGNVFEVFPDGTRTVLTKAPTPPPSTPSDAG